MNLFDVSVCTKTIYNYIAMGLLKVKNIDLRQKVRRRKRKEKKNHDDGRTLGESIDCRNPLVDERSTFGNWELDTIVGKKGTDPVLLAADERKKRKRHLVKIRAKTAEAVAEGIAKLRELYGHNFHRYFVRSPATMGASLLVCKKLFQRRRCTMLILMPLGNVERTRSRMHSFGISFRRAWI